MLLVFRAILLVVCSHPVDASNDTYRDPLTLFDATINVRLDNAGLRTTNEHSFSFEFGPSDRRRVLLISFRVRVNTIVVNISVRRPGKTGVADDPPLKGINRR